MAKKPKYGGYKYIKKNRKKRKGQHSKRPNKRTRKQKKTGR